MKNPFARSLTLRLLAIFIVIGIVVLVLLASLFRQGMTGQFRRNIQPHLAQYVEYVHRDLGLPPDVKRADAIAKSVPVEIALYQQGRFVHSTDGREPDFDTMQFGRVDRRLESRLAGRSNGPRPRVSIGRADAARIIRVEQNDWTVFYTLDPRRRRSADNDELWIALAAVALVLLGGWWIIRRQLRPIGAIKHTVSRISQGELQARTGISGHDDLATLGSSIDGMAARLQDMLDAKRELLLSVSHELRSPLTRARVALELLPDSSARERVSQDLVEMSDLIDGLLESERLREAHAALDTQQLDMRALVTDTANALLSTHDAKASIIVPDAALLIEGDAARLSVLVRTLVHNAVTHGCTDAATADVTVTLVERENDIELCVEDRGPGIAEERLERVTEAFERLDASRSRNTGGVGLGLNLARLVAEAHGGSLELENRDGGGLRARARLPKRPRDGQRSSA